MKLKDLLACAVTGMLLCTSCIKDEAPNAEADIEKCILPEDILTDANIDYHRSYDESTKAYPLYIEVVKGTDLTQLAPTFELTPGATIEPASGSTQNFSKPVRYTVTSEDGNWHREYLITVSYPETGNIPSFYSFEEVKTGTYNGNNYNIFYQTAPGRATLTWASGNPGFALTGYKAYNPQDFPTIPNPNGHTGSCVELVTRVTGSLGVKVGMPIASGNLFIGDFKVLDALTDALSATKFGTPFYYEPTKLSGYYKYKAGPKFYENKEYTDKKDIFNIYAIFYEKLDDKNNPRLDGHIAANNFEHKNMVALALIKDAKETDEWTRFELEFDYQRYGKTIDPVKLKEGKYYLSIVMASSKEGDSFKGAPGSTLLIDDVQLEHK